MIYLYIHNVYYIFIIIYIFKISIKFATIHIHENFIYYDNIQMIVTTIFKIIPKADMPKSTHALIDLKYVRHIDAGMISALNKMK